MVPLGVLIECYIENINPKSNLELTVVDVQKATPHKTLQQTLQQTDSSMYSRWHNFYQGCFPATRVMLKSLKYGRARQ